MSVANLLKDIVTGNFTSAEQRIQDWWSGVSPSIKAFIGKVESDEGKILEGLVAVAAQDVLTGGLTTASFVAAAKDVEGKLVAQNIAMGQQDIFAALNVAVSYAKAQQAASPESAAVVDPTPAPVA